MSDERGVCFEVTGGVARLLPSQEQPLGDGQRPPRGPAAGDSSNGTQPS